MFDLVEMSDTFLTELDHTNGRSKRLFNLNGKGETKMDPTENAGKGIVNDIMMILDMDKVLELQDEFQKAENGLTLYEFVYVMLRFLKKSQRHENIDDDSKRVIENISKMSETTKVSALAELFAQIDINGDDSLSWEEFCTGAKALLQARAWARQTRILLGLRLHAHQQFPLHSWHRIRLPHRCLQCRARFRFRFLSPVPFRIRHQYSTAMTCHPRGRQHPPRDYSQ